MCKSDEQLQDEEQRRLRRLYDQQEAGDYSRDEDGIIERCEDCGRPLNQHGHCPSCDY